MPEGFAEVITWGTKSTGGNGLKDQLRAKLFGGNIGHAAIRLTIPIDDAGLAQKMIDEQCYHNGQVVLPHSKKKLPDGSHVYEVYISAWSDDKVTLDRNFVADSQEELGGVHFDWDPKWAELIQPETRRYKGLVGKSIMTWGPEVISHQRGNLTDAQFQQFGDIQEYQKNLKEVNNYDLLLGRIKSYPQNNKSINLNDTEKILLDRLYPHWKSEIKNPKKISSSELNDIINKVTSAKQNFEMSESYLESKNKVGAIAANNIKDLMKLVEQDSQKWGKITPTTAQKIVDSKNLLLDSERQLNVAQLLSYTPQQIVELRNNLNSAKTPPNPFPEKLQSYFEYYTPSDQALLEQNFSFGLPPDHIVQIPLKSQNVDGTKRNGLDPQAMLLRAKQVAISNEKFSLTNTNCSKVAGWVLSAGANDNKSKKIFSRDAFKLFATPQMVFNNALRYLRGTSTKANQKYDEMVDAAVSKQPKNDEKKLASFVPGFIEISFDGIDAPDDQKCKVLLDNFENAIKNGTDVPYLSDATKLKVESIIKIDEALKTKFYSLCDQSLAKARNQNQQFHHKKAGEWEDVKKIIQQQGAQGKISKKTHPELSRSYIVLDINGVLKPFRVSSDILGQGAEGKVRIIESEDGLRYAVKISANKASLDNEIALMKEAGVAIGEFTRQRENKISKSSGQTIGDKRYVIQPLYEGGELTDALKNKEMTKKEKLFLAVKAGQAIQSLHDKSILHRDIKPSNLMLSKDKHSNITRVDAIDFGGALKIPNPPGTLNSSRTGSPMYLAPEVDGEEIRSRVRKWKTQERIVVENSNKILEVTSHLSDLSIELRKLQGQSINDINKFFEKLPGGDTYIAQKEKQKLIDFLSTYDGTNQAQLKDQIKALATHQDYSGSINGCITSYCDTIDQINAVKESITHFEQQKATAELNFESSKADEQRFKNEFYELYNTKTNFSLASDVYSFGIMLQKDFGFKLEELGLEKMLATIPNERPSMNEVQLILNKLCEPYLAQRPIQPVGNKAVRLPDKVEPKSLKENGLLLNDQQMQKLRDIQVDTKNANVKIDNVTVFLSKEGGAFALHSPIQSGANGATYLAQNLDTQQWVALKVVQGEERKIRGPLSALTVESEALQGLQLRQGTLEIKNEETNREIHICIQPYAYGKDYFDVIKQAKSEEQHLPIEQTVLMSLKAIEALVDIHEKGGYLHRDVKPENMLWDPVENKYTFVDYGCAKKGEGPDKTVQDGTKQGTEKYAAPELNFSKLFKPDRIYSIKTDAYALGVTIQDILSATKPSDNPAYQQLKQLQERLTAANPEERVTPSEALRELKIITHALNDKQENKNIEPLLMLNQLHSSGEPHLSHLAATQNPSPSSVQLDTPPGEHERKKTLH